MGTVIVELPARGSAGRPVVLRLSPGETVTFGRGAPDVPVDIELPFVGLSRLGGRLTAVHDYWTLSNLAPHSPYVVENLEGAGEHLKVAPGRLDAPVAFEMSRLLLPAQDAPCVLKVYAPQHVIAVPAAPAGRLGEPTVAVYSLDPGAKYFRVLVALCEHRLRDPGSVQVPTTGQVAARLRALAGYQDLTPSAINYHIDYLAHAKLRLRESGSPVPGSRLERKKEMLVAFALRFGLVREEHLTLLPPVRGRSTA